MKIKAIYKIVFILILAVIAGIYIFIPSSIRVSSFVKTRGFETNVFGILSNNEKWQNEYQGTDGFAFKIRKTIYPRIFIDAIKESRLVSLTVEILNDQKLDSCTIYWHCDIAAGYTPWSRLSSYINAHKLKSEVTTRLRGLAGYAGKIENIYGIQIGESIIADTIIATQLSYESELPSENTICEKATLLRQMITAVGINITDSVMSARVKNEKDEYRLMVGFPVDRIPTTNHNIVFKKMIPGKLLTGTVYGGPISIRNGYAQVKKYITDRSIEEAALPYEVHITNRCIELDTNKWVTKICYPVF